MFSPRLTPGEPFPKEISWYKKKGQSFEGLHNGTIDNYVYTIGYYGDMHLQRPDKSSIGYYKIQVFIFVESKVRLKNSTFVLDTSTFVLILRGEKSKYETQILDTDMGHEY